MHYYDPNDRRPRRWALIAAAAYALLLGGAFVFVSFDFEAIHNKPGDTITIEFIEPEPEPPQPQQTVNEPRMHTTPARTEQTAQVAGRDAVTQTPNPRAAFHMPRGGADEPENAGNPRAPEGEDRASGTGPGLNPDGFDQLDKGLQGRGLRGALPKPQYPGTKSGKVIIRVTVNAEGAVTSASYVQDGSTTNDAELIGAAIEAAKKVRFTESRAAAQGGNITYLFGLTAR